ncbi:hypothetical protein FQN57_005691 [Myotisia sp. PD_48]|nr:hypothetical protein FQN57_005691 [Myotisia sp. PD_48]
MLAWFVDGFVKAGMLTPNYILVMFIVSVIAGAWAIETLFRYGHTKRSASFVSFVDLCFVGAFIASVYQLRGITSQSCGNFSRSPFLLSLGPFGLWGARGNNPLSRDPNKICAMLKTCFAFGIMNTISTNRVVIDEAAILAEEAIIETEAVLGEGGTLMFKKAH